MGLYLLNVRHHVERETAPKLDDLAEAIADELRQNDTVPWVLHWESGDRRSPDTFSLDELQSIGRWGARVALKEWDADYYSRQADAGRAGGLKTKRSKTTTLRAFLDVEGRPIKEQMKILDASRRTILRRRAELKLQRDLECQQRERELDREYERLRPHMLGPFVPEYRRRWRASQELDPEINRILNSRRD